MEATAEAGTVRILDTVYMAAHYKLTTQRIRALAHHRGVGTQISRGVFVFAPSDIERLKPGPVGRPPTRIEEQNHDEKERARTG